MSKVKEKEQKSSTRQNPTPATPPATFDLSKLPPGVSMAGGANGQKIVIPEKKGFAFSGVKTPKEMEQILASITQHNAQPYRPAPPPTIPPMFQGIKLCSNDKALGFPPCSGAGTPSTSVKADISASPRQTGPLTALFTFGFWAGAKLGLCPRVTESASAIIYNNAQSAEAAHQKTRKASANKIFAQQASSLKDALIYCFGKAYAKGSLEEKQKMEAFVIDVVLGDVAADIGKKLNQIAQISDEHSRYEGVSKLMMEHNDAIFSIQTTVGLK